MDDKIILVINPGSTSTKIAMYMDKEQLFGASVKHTDDELKKYLRISDQFSFRKCCVEREIKKAKLSLCDIDAVVGRGGQIPNIEGGGYIVDEALKSVLMSDKILPHASNLGGLIAAAIAEPLGKPAFIYDAIGTDEISDVARITGVPTVSRAPFCHVLNSKAMGRKYAESIGKKYEDLKLIVAHLGGGISISAHERGRIIDVVSDDGGPFSPERAGSFPMMYLVDMCYSGKYSKDELSRKLRGEGGMKAYLGTSDCQEIERRIESGDKFAGAIYGAQAYQIAKGIGNLIPVFKEKPDCIILTGGVAYSETLTRTVREYVRWIAPVETLPGEHEMEALALGALRVLRGEEKAKTWQGASKKTLPTS